MPAAAAACSDGSTALAGSFAGVSTHVTGPRSRDHCPLPPMRATGVMPFLYSPVWCSSTSVSSRVRRRQLVNMQQCCVIKQVLMQCIQVFAKISAATTHHKRSWRVCCCEILTCRVRFEIRRVTDCPGRAPLIAKWNQLLLRLW